MGIKKSSPFEADAETTRLCQKYLEVRDSAPSPYRRAISHVWSERVRDLKVVDCFGYRWAWNWAEKVVYRIPILTDEEITRQLRRQAQINRPSRSSKFSAGGEADNATVP